MTPFTPSELRKRVLDRFREIAEEWASYPGKTSAEMARGVVFSILAELDGDGPLPRFLLIAAPDPMAGRYFESRGERWVDPGTHINAGVALHEEWHSPTVDDDEPEWIDVNTKEKSDEV